MTVVKEEQTEAQLDAFLQEIGVLSTPLPPQDAEKESSLDELLGEVLELIQPPPPRRAPPSLPALPAIESTKIRSYSTIWITAALLFGFVVGSGFGFFWGKTRPANTSEQAISHQISHWIHELDTLYNRLDPPHETIESFEPPTEMERLAPSEIT